MMNPRWSCAHRQQGPPHEPLPRLRRAAALNPQNGRFSIADRRAEPQAAERRREEPRPCSSTHNKAAALKDAPARRMRPLSVIVLAGDASSAALAPLGGKRSSLEVLLGAIASSRRLQPLAASVHIVLPAPVVGSAQVASVLSEFGLTQANVVSNGASHAGDWQGDVTDLLTALRQTGLSGRHVMVVSANRLTFAPGYNFQRLVEHGLTRDGDAVGVVELGPVETSLLGSCGHTVIYTHDSPQLVPPVASLSYQDQADEGSWIAQPLLLLTPTTLSSSQLQGSKAPDLVALAAELHHSTHSTQGSTRSAPPLHALALGAGTLHLANPASVQHADKCVAHLLPLAPAKRQVEEGSEEAAAAAAAPVVPLAHSVDAMEQLVTAFNARHFGLVADLSKLPMPPSFYMSTYRRLAADMLR